jgi:penicillin amidase
MKIIWKIVLGLLALIFVLVIFTYSWLIGTAPQYSGKLKMKGLKETVEIIYDDFGVPHIYAGNAEDAYFALGFAQAQERLFQMEMIRRATSGKLSEILGKDLLPIDKIMLTLSIRHAAEKSAAKAFENMDAAYKKQSLAYLEGVNRFIDQGNLPIEFTLIGFKPEHFTPEDIYTAIGYMSLSFTAAISQEPMMTNILKTLGDKYLVDFSLDSLSNAGLYEESPDMLSNVFSPLELQHYLPIPIWEGSNNWVMSAARSKSGKVLLANDTHIAYSQPAVWYEAHLNYPGFEMAGYYLAGVPFALIGHNRHYGWGLTIFPFDNMDLYREKINPENPNQYWHSGHWNDFRASEKTIKVKDGKEEKFIIKSSIHGPVLNPVYENISGLEENPITLWWSLHDIKTSALSALYRINNSQNIATFEEAMKGVDIIGLNIVYGDTDGNIAWWATGKIPVRSPYVNSKLILDGADSSNDFKAYYPFDKNPKSINPPDGFICTANNAPPPVDGIIYPGYYFPGYRSGRITKIVNSQKTWNRDEMKRIQNDVKSDRDIRIRDLVLNTVDLNEIKSEDKTFAKAIDQLADWDGEYKLDRLGPAIFTSMIYYVLQQSMADELGEEQFNRLVSSTPMRSSIEHLFFNEASLWWDNIQTKEVVETRSQQFATGLKLALADLSENLGDDLSQWQWGKIHTLTHIHPIGREEPFDKIFNIGPFPDKGGNEVIIKEAFKYSGHGPYKVGSGPAMRLLLDFAQTDKALSIIPTGQSGNIMSDHYADQAQMFVSGKYKVLEMNKDEIDKSSVLLLIPE